MILQQGHAVILTFKVVTKILHVTRRLNMLIISNLWNSFKIRLQIRKLIGPDMIYLQGHAVTLTFKVATKPKCGAWHDVSICWSFLWDSFKIGLQIRKLGAGQEFGTYWQTNRRLYAPPNILNDLAEWQQPKFTEKFGIWKMAHTIR